jgi:hypothetical protein
MLVGSRVRKDLAFFVSGPTYLGSGWHGAVLVSGWAEIYVPYRRLYYYIHDVQYNFHVITYILASRRRIVHALVRPASLVDC